MISRAVASVGWRHMKRIKHFFSLNNIKIIGPENAAS